MKTIADTLQLLRSPDTWTRVVIDGHMVPLLPLLEHPHSAAESELSAFLLQLKPAINHSAVQLLRRLVLYALQSANEYWTVLATGWLDDGFPFDAEVCSIAISLPTSISQRLRHRAFSVAKRWEREHHASGDA